MILVVEAIGRRCRSLKRQRIVPVSTSTRMADSAVIGEPFGSSAVGGGLGGALRRDRRGRASADPGASASAQSARSQTAGRRRLLTGQSQMRRQVNTELLHRG